MGTLRHRNQRVSKPEHKESAAKKPKTPRNGRFVRNLLLTAGIATGIIAPSLLNAQDNIKRPINKPTDKQNEIMIAAAGESTPANTYTVPARDGKSLGSDPSQKWCDGIEIANGELTFKGINIHGRRGNATVDVKGFFDTFGITDATTENIKWVEFRIINGEKKAYFVVETELMSVLVTSNPDFEKTNDTWGKAMLATDISKIFTHPGAIYIATDGAVVATTPTTLIIIQAGPYGKKFSRTYKKMFGEEVDNLKNPRFNRSTIENTVELRDETFITQKGNKVVITIPIYNWDGISASVDENFTKN